MADNKTISALNWRYATKKYDTSKKLTADQLAIITESLRLSPSSFGLQAWKFIHVTDAALREKLKGAAWGQPQLTDASDIFVLASMNSIDAAFIDQFVNSVAATRGISPDVLKEYRDSMVGAVSSKSPADLKDWLARQVYIALGVALSAAAENEIDASPMEGFVPAQFDEILGLAKENLSSRVILAVGFRSPEDHTSPDKAKKSRFSKEEVFIER